MSGCMVSCVNPEKRSNTETTDPPPRVLRTSSTRGIAICGISVTLFSFLQLTVIRMPPDWFGTHTRGLDHGEVECWMSPAAR